MTDKQIIIDDVDISECNFTLERDGKIKCECTHATGFGVICDCEAWKTCHYKNYKRKEQECDQLKVELEQEKALKETYLTCYKAKYGDIEGKLFKLKAENEELKEKNKKLKEEIEDLITEIARIDI